MVVIRVRDAELFVCLLPFLYSDLEFKIFEFLAHEFFDKLFSSNYSPSTLSPIVFNNMNLGLALVRQTLGFQTFHL